MEPEKKKDRPVPGTYHLCVDMQRMFAEPTECVNGGLNPRINGASSFHL
jgi:hypothetical protein